MGLNSEHEHQWQMQNSNQAIEYGRETIKTGIALNGGGLVAMLALLPDWAEISRTDFQTAVICFAAGAGLAFFSHAGGYFAQTFFTLANRGYRLGLPEGPKYERFATASTVITVVLILASMAALAAGAIHAYRAVDLAPEPKPIEWNFMPIDWQPQALSFSSAKISGPSTIRP